MTFGEPNRGEPNVPLTFWRHRQNVISEGVQPERGPRSVATKHKHSVKRRELALPTHKRAKDGERLTLFILLFIFQPFLRIFTAAGGIIFFSLNQTFFYLPNKHFHFSFFLSLLFISLSFSSFHLISFLKYRRRRNYQVS
jgi:hypothetical protein